MGMVGMQYVYIDGVGLGVSWAGQGATCLNEVLDGIGESMGFRWAEEEEEGGGGGMVEGADWTCRGYCTAYIRSRKGRG